MFGQENRCAEFVSSSLTPVLTGGGRRRNMRVQKNETTRISITEHGDEPHRRSLDRLRKRSRVTSYIGFGGDGLDKIHVILVQLSCNALFTRLGAQIRYRDRPVIVHQQLAAFVPHATGDAGSAAPAFVPARLLVRQTIQRNKRPLSRLDDVAHAYLVGRPPKKVSSSRPPSALEKPGFEKSVENLFKVSLRNLLSSRNVLDLGGVSPAVIGYVEHGAHAVSA
jgi:hypothetical protein